MPHNFSQAFDIIPNKKYCVKAKKEVDFVQNAEKVREIKLLQSCNFLKMAILMTFFDN